MFAFIVLASFLASTVAFAPAASSSMAARFSNKLSMAGDFDAKSLPGVSGPFGFFDPLGLAPENKRDFMKYRESELKHGRLAMLAFLGIVFGELLGNAGFSLIGASINGPAIFQYQQAEGALNAWSANVIGLTLAVEGYNIVNGWETPGEEVIGIAALKDTYSSGDLSFDPLGLKPFNAKALKEIQTKEINNGRLAMLAVAGIVAQELVTGQSIF
jgi:light-harvesting complex I chlorophyll a/b binding protein 1